MRARGRLGLALLCAGAVEVGCATGRPATSPAPEASAGGALAWPQGEELAFRLQARGTQNYACRQKADASGVWSWELVAPEAELLDRGGNVVGRHQAGPTWESAQDGSKVAARVTARADAPVADAIPWLLLQVTEASPSGMFAGVKSVRRVDTRGGKAPSSACASGQEAKVPYTATYEFSRAQ